MPKQTLTSLEFPGIIRLVQAFAVSGLGRALLASLSPVGDFSLIQNWFQEIGELRDHRDREGLPPLADFADPTPWLHKAAVRGSLLPPEAFNDFLEVLRLSRRVKHYLHQAEADAACLHALSGKLADLPTLLEAIQRSISPHNLILDQASPALAQVRRELTQTRERLNRQIKDTFFHGDFLHAVQNPVISQRHGRYVIPVKADHKGAISGIIHDQSQTRATLFVEPLAIVEQNNALNLLSNREKREEEAVLRHLTDLVRAYQTEITETLAVLAELDAIWAKVRFAEEYQAREPIWRRHGGVDFRQARHPLLLHRERTQLGAPRAVPVDLKLTPERRFLIISGANAGGKTVALKTLGLLTVMVQSGLPIPVAEGSEFFPFDRVMADIGDPQDLEQNLSTFSAHLKRALEMLQAFPGRALILLDELGTATDPTEGGALALALLRAFYHRGAWGAATTHLPLLKGLAQREPGFENVSVIFDDDTGRPTYRLAYGVAGASNALKMAREFGLSAEILAEAEGYLDRDELRAYRLLAEVEAAQQHLVHQEQELARLREELAHREEKLTGERRELEEVRRRLEGEVKNAALARIKEAEAEFKEIVQRLKQGQASWGKLRQEFSERQAQLLQDLTPGPLPPAPEAPVFSPGQKIFLPALGLSGKVLDRTRDGKLEVQVRQVKLRVSPEEITPTASEAAKPAAAKVAVDTYRLPPEKLPSINLVGLRVDEALPLVDRLLDQALVHGRERVDIIHGTGTGRLKQAIREHLKHNIHVKAVLDDLNPGVTVVDLK